MESTAPLLQLDDEPPSSSSPLPAPHEAEGDYSPEASKTFKDFFRFVFWKETVKIWKIAGPIAITLLCQYGTNTLNDYLCWPSWKPATLCRFRLPLCHRDLRFRLPSWYGECPRDPLWSSFWCWSSSYARVFTCKDQSSSYSSAVSSSRPFTFLQLLSSKSLARKMIFANLAGKFSILVLPNLFSLSIYFPTQKFLQAQRKVGVLSWIAFTTLLLHAFWLWLFIYELGLGATGAAIALDLSGWTSSLAQAVYVMVWCKEGWRGFSWAAFKDIWSFVTLSLASAVMLCLELCLNINGIELMLFLGINAAISVRVSNELGMGHPRAAKYSVIVTVLQSLVIGLILMAVVLITKDYFAYIFTSNEEMRAATSKLAFILAITMVLNSVQPVISGVAIGGGWQALVAYINIGCYYVFGLPLGYLLGYRANLGVEGVWGGMLCGTALQTLLLLIVAQTAERMRKWGGEDIDTNDDQKKINIAANEA
ncbi:hypothetical protein OIU84_001092 [Salix udensis]|uniref:Protein DETOXIFICATION n=1 Tax=Salix udensis TaxID=889485 RepID=A0AAD6K616_9ROSI|nr:hypothetical protein OIU84_001092 [Salix udensis]